MSIWESLFGRTTHEPVEPEQPYKAWWQDNWDAITARYKLGTEFSYLGRTLLVAQYDWRQVGRFDWQPYIICEYADNNGKLDEWCFYAKMFPILLERPIKPPPSAGN